MNNGFKNILVISNNYKEQCSDVPDPVACENKIWEEGYTINNKKIIPSKLLTKKQQNIELSNARLMTVIDEANMPKNRLNFLSQDFINSLPPSDREEYKRLAKKEMMKRVLKNYFWDEITMNEKELASIELDLQKVSASQFYPKQAINEVNELVKIFETTEQGSK